MGVGGEPAECCRHLCFSLARNALWSPGPLNSCGHSVWTVLVLAPENRSLRRRKLESRSALGRRTGGGREIDEERQRTTPEMFLGQGGSSRWRLASWGNKSWRASNAWRWARSHWNPFCHLLLDATPLEQSQSQRQCRSGLMARRGRPADECPQKSPVSRIPQV